MEVNIKAAASYEISILISKTT